MVPCARDMACSGPANFVKERGCHLCEHWVSRVSTGPWSTEKALPSSRHLLHERAFTAVWSSQFKRRNL